MKEAIKKGFYIGIGAAALTKEKAEKELKHLARRYKLGGKIKKELVAKFLAEARKEKNRFEAAVKKEALKSIRQLGYLSKPEVRKLKEKINALEKRLSAKGHAVFAGAKSRVVVRGRRIVKHKKK